MRKSTLFISVVLTTFMLAVLFGVASAYQKIVSTPTQSEPVAQTEQVQVAEVQSVEQFMSMAPVQTGIVSPEQAAVLATQMLGNTDVYSVESTTYEGAAAYLVTFTSGDLVYVSPTGQILAVTQLEPVVVVVPQRNRDRNNNGGGGGNDGGEDHESHEEHEEEHED